MSIVFGKKNLTNINIKAMSGSALNAKDAKFVANHHNIITYFVMNVEKCTI